MNRQTAAALIAAARLHLRVAAVTPFGLIFGPLTPLVYGVLAGAAAPDQRLQIAVGAGFAGFVAGMVTQSVLTILQERAWVTFEQTLLTQTPLEVALVGRILGMTVLALANLPVAWLGIRLLFGPIEVPSPLQVVVCMVVAIGGFVGLSIFIVGLMARHRYYAGVPNALFPLLMLLGGVLVPIAALPAWLSVAARLLGSTWAMEGVRQAGAGGSGWGFAGIGALVGGAEIALAIFYLARADRVIRRSPEAFLR